MKVTQSMIEAVKNVMEAGWEKEKTSTGMKVYGSSYGDSKKARKDQTKSSVDDVKEPKKKDLEEDMDCVTKPEVKAIADKEAKKEVKGHEKKMHQKEGYDFASRLVVSHYETELIEAEINEVLGKDASAGEWISDFVHSDNPKFKGKSKAMRKKMALAAYYAKQRNEEVEIEEELKGGQKKLDVAEPKGKLTAADFKKLRKEEEECGCDDEGHEDEKEDKELVKKLVKKDALKKEEIDPNVRTKDMIRGRKPTSQKDDVGPGSDGKSTKVKFSGGPMKEETIDEATPPKGTDVSDKSWLKTAGKKPGPLHNVGKGLKAFLKGKPEPMESVEQDGEVVREAKQPEQGNVPFDPPYNTTKGDDIVDKSGAKHTPMSRAKDLARTAMKRIKTEMLGKAPGNN